MSTSESWILKQNNSKSKTQLTYEVLTKLQEILDAYGISRQEQAYGALLRICVQNKTQLQNIVDIIERILVTEKINIVEIVFPHGTSKHKKNGFMLYIKGSPHDAIKSIFDETDTNWKITAVEYEQTNNNSSLTSNGGNGNGANGRFYGHRQLENDQFFETQYEIIVKNTMQEMKINRIEAENHIYMWFRWKTQPDLNITFDDYKKQELEGRTESTASSTFSSFFGSNNVTRQIITPFVPDESQDSNTKKGKQERQKKNQGHKRIGRNAEKNNITISEVKKSLKNGDKLFDKNREPQLLHDGLGEESAHFIERNQNQIPLVPDGQIDCLFACIMFCLKSFILLSLTILLYILYTNHNRSSILEN